MGWFERTRNRAISRMEMNGPEREGERYALVLAVAQWGWALAGFVLVFALIT